jgi:hypothetical protein
MATKTFRIGQLVRLSTTVLDYGGAAAAPGSITLRIKDPDPESSVSAVVPVNDGVGLYHYDLAVDFPGYWHYRWTTTGANAATDEREFFVDPRVVA